MAKRPLGAMGSAMSAVRNRQTGLLTVSTPSLTETYHSYSVLTAKPGQTAVVMPDATPLLTARVEYGFPSRLCMS